MSSTKLTPANNKEFLEANKEAFVVLVFDAAFSGQEDIVDEAVKSLTKSEELKDKIVLATVDVEENNDLATQFNVVSVPLIVCTKNGQNFKVDQLEPSKLIKTITEYLRRFDTQVVDDVDPKESFKKYLQNLINRAPVMIFMKGEPKAPRCGFSKQLVELLSKHNIEYDTFDILQDEQVRQGLKELSDWPTYPQIYSKGEFVGGLDILKQLAESGELEKTLKPWSIVHRWLLYCVN